MYFLDRDYVIVDVVRFMHFVWGENSSSCDVKGTVRCSMESSPRDKGTENQKVLPPLVTAV